MRRTLPALISVSLLCVFLFGCAVTGEKLRLDEYKDLDRPLSGPEMGPEIENLTARINGLWSDLKDQKLTMYLTKKKLGPYFESEKDLTEFVAIYASLMRQNHFSREIVLKYKINGIKIEPNGVIARVDFSFWGRVYFLWYSKIHETQRWEKSGGRWYLRPEAY